ncbi:MAG: hypothetical protein WCP55_18320, partial [Lentisphaerota bacterium]
MPDNNSYKRQSYFRLLTYTKPYKRKLAIGILAGFVSAGSLFGSLFWIKPFFQSLENGGSATLIVKQTAAQSSGATGLESSPKPAEAAPSTGKKDANLLEMVQISQKIVDHLHVNVQLVKNGMMTWQCLLIASSIFILLWFLRSAGIYVNKLYTRWVGMRVVADLRDKAFEKL